MGLKQKASSLSSRVYNLLEETGRKNWNSQENLLETIFLEEGTIRSNILF